MGKDIKTCQEEKCTDRKFILCIYSIKLIDTIFTATLYKSLVISPSNRKFDPSLSALFMQVPNYECDRSYVMGDSGTTNKGYMLEDNTHTCSNEASLTFFQPVDPCFNNYKRCDELFDLFTG